MTAGVLVALGTVYVVWGSTYLAIKYIVERPAAVPRDGHPVPPRRPHAARRRPGVPRPCGVPDDPERDGHRGFVRALPAGGRQRPGRGRGAGRRLRPRGAAHRRDAAVGGAAARAPARPALGRHGRRAADRHDRRRCPPAARSAGRGGPRAAAAGLPVVAAVVGAGPCWPPGGRCPPTRSSRPSWRWRSAARRWSSSARSAGSGGGWSWAAPSRRPGSRSPTWCVVGSVVGYSAYVWLLARAPLSLATTYAYVNPAVAVALGALFLAEPLTLERAGRGRGDHRRGRLRDHRRVRGRRRADADRREARRRSNRPEPGRNVAPAGQDLTRERNRSSGCRPAWPAASRWPRRASPSRGRPARSAPGSCGG